MRQVGSLPHVILLFIAGDDGAVTGSFTAHRPRAPCLCWGQEHPSVPGRAWDRTVLEALPPLGSWREAEPRVQCGPRQSLRPRGVVKSCPSRDESQDEPTVRGTSPDNPSPI